MSIASPAFVVNDRRHSAKQRNEMAAHPIPVMTDPLGKHWDQPARAHILVDAKHAVMTLATFERLKEYSATVPTGVYPGKMWRRLNGRFDHAFILAGGKPNWMLCWYGLPTDGSDPAKFCSNNYRDILLTDADIEEQR